MGVTENTDAAGQTSTIDEKATENADGTTDSETVTTNTDGTTTEQKVTVQTDGSIKTETTEKDATGTITSEDTVVVEAVNADCVLGNPLSADNCPSHCGTLTQSVVTPAQGAGTCNPDTYECQPGEGSCPKDCTLGSVPTAASCTSSCGTVTQEITADALNGGSCNPQVYSCQPGDGACPATTDAPTESPQAVETLSTASALENILATVSSVVMMHYLF